MLSILPIPFLMPPFQGKKYCIYVITVPCPPLGHMGDYVPSSTGTSSQFHVLHIWWAHSCMLVLYYSLRLLVITNKRSNAQGKVSYFFSQALPSFFSLFLLTFLRLFSHGLLFVLLYFSISVASQLSFSIKRQIKDTKRDTFLHCICGAMRRMKEVSFSANDRI